MTSDPEGELQSALKSQVPFICAALKQTSETLKLDAVEVATGEDVLMTGDAEIASATLSLSLLKLN